MLETLYEIALQPQKERKFMKVKTLILKGRKL